MRRITDEEISARIKSGDQSLLSWLKSSDRRGGFLLDQKDSAATRFLSVFWRKAITINPGITSVLNYGCGSGTHAAGFLRHDSGYGRYIGSDPDPECVRICRRKYNALPGFQFHTMDLMKKPNLPKTFEYITITQLFEWMPGYVDFMSHVWGSCTKGMLVLFSEPLVKRPNDAMQVDPVERRLHVAYSIGKFQKFCQRLDPNAEFRTIFSDNSQTREHLVLLRKEDSKAPDLKCLHYFAEDGHTFPYSEDGLV